MTEKEQKSAAKKFAEYWKNKGDEKSDTQSYWLMLLREVLGIDESEKYIEFEKRVKNENTNFIDGYIPAKRIMIEQKSLSKDLLKGILQSDGTFLTPFEQAKRYIVNLPVDEHPRWIITCNFAEILVYDMSKPHSDPEKILLKDLPKEYYRLNFLVDTGSKHLKKEMEVSLQAGELVGKLYTALLKQYKNPESEESLKSLNMLCVRLVFCLYAEDAGIFGKHQMFHDYLERFQPRDVRKALIELFEVLDQKDEERDPYLDYDLAAFPYVNGGLFKDDKIEIPNFSEEICQLLLENASADFDWSEISPTIFGAVFESTLNPETRRSGGMHYTSIENIHKVIDPLFLDDLKAEFEEIKQFKQANVRKNKLEEFQHKLSTLTFLDPACGSGNFLTETYISLRRLENEILRELYTSNDQLLIEVTGSAKFIMVSIGQFYGIEINDFAVTVAKTALWIAESQMMKETEEIVQMNLDFLPLKSYANIVEGNALRVDWESVVPKDKLNYIMGNPPFVGSKYSDGSQKQDMDFIFKEDKKIKYRKLDYVSCWYKKSCDLMMGTKVRTALVSTNSISQGEQVAILWQYLFEKGVHIDFAHKTFRWDSEANIKAHVHCIIIGFSIADNPKDKMIFDSERMFVAENINGYLIDAVNIFVDSKNQPLDNRKKMIAPNKPCDYNNLKIEENEYDDFIKQCPDSKKWIKKMVGAQEFIKNKDRYCLWLVNCSPKELKQMPNVMERVKKCREDRIKANTSESLKLAETPTLFREQINPKNYLIIPCVSSEQRKYIPMGFLDENTIPVMGTLIIPNAELYDFGILTSNVHMAWMRTVCGRLEMRYRYSKDIVYNNFTWCNPTDKQKATIEKTAQAILDARALYPDCSLADLYDELTMPPELRKAHQANDFAVMEAYGFDKKITESEIVAELMGMYKELTEKNS